MQLLAKEQLITNDEWLNFQVDLPAGTYLLGVFGEDGEHGVAKFIIVK